VSSLTTEARIVPSQHDIQFTNNTIETFLIQESIEAHYNIKITAALLKASNNLILFEKKQDITEFLRKRGQASLNVQIKSN
jgi:hypothetical protein